MKDLSKVKTPNFKKINNELRNLVAKLNCVQITENDIVKIMNIVDEEAEKQSSLKALAFELANRI